MLHLENATSQNATSQNAGYPASSDTNTCSGASTLIDFRHPIYAPAGYEEAKEIPSYAIRIPFSNDGRSPFEPATIAIPATMTVIWFNDDQNPHTVTMNSKKQ